MNGAIDHSQRERGGSTRPRFNPWRVYAACALGCAALSAAGYALGVSPAMARAAKLGAEHAELIDRRKHAGQLAADASAARTDLAATRDAQANFPLHLEPATAVNQRLARLTDMANEANLSVAEIRPGVVTEGRDFDAVPISLGGTGTYPACAAFMHRLHDQFPDTAVRSFRASQGEGSTGSFSFDLVWHTARRK